ncbi:MAG: PAS domain-containing protein [Parcubacteria group bacterium]|nr:PAS domain-containing protein [Parcubacteria group bacterium]
MSFFSSLFHTAKKTPQSEAEKLLQYLFGLINRADLIVSLTEQHRALKTLSGGIQRRAYATLYRALEDFIVSHKPLIVKKEFTKESLRAEIAEHITSNELPDELRLIFLLPLEQAVLVCGVGLSEMVSEIIRIKGEQWLAVFIQNSLKGTSLESVAIKDQQIDYAMALHHARTTGGATVQEITSSFKKFSQALYAELQKENEARAKQLFSEAYLFIKESYESDLLSLFMEIVQSDILEKEKLTFLSQESLEQKMKNRTEELEKAKVVLEQKVEDITKTQAALMNVLEDERALQVKLKEERDRLQIIVSSIGEALFVVDTSYTVLLTNQAVEKIFKISLSEFDGKDLRSIVKMYKGTVQIEENQNPLKNVIEKGESVATTVEDALSWQIGASDKQYPVAFTASPLQGEGIIGAVIVVRDITEEKKLDEARRSFVSVTSHQLRTPLSSIRWFIEMLLEGDAGEVPKEQKDLLDQVYGGTDRMLNMINLLLQIGRVESGRIKVEPTPIDFKKFTDDIVAAFKDQLVLKKQTIQVKSAPEVLPSISLDYDMLWQVVQNLVSNALRYSPENATVNITIAIDETKKEMTYAVEDHGIGIQESQQEKIFEQFFRTPGAIKAVPDGSGLGLYLAKKIVKEWEGKIWFVSQEGKGSTFYFTIPLKGMQAREGDVKLGIDKEVKSE